MATLIGLCIRYLDDNATLKESNVPLCRVQLLRSISSRFKVDIKVTPGTHQSESQVNKQLADKERVAAALENSHLLQVCNTCLKGAL